MKERNQFGLYTLFSIITLCGLIAAILNGTSPFIVLIFLLVVWSIDLRATRVKASRDRLRLNPP